MKTKMAPFFLILLSILLLSLLQESAGITKISAALNDTAVEFAGGGVIVDDESEQSASVESGMQRRMLLGNKYYTYGGLKPGGTICGVPGKSYAICLPGRSGNLPGRGCPIYNGCRHGH